MENLIIASSEIIFEYICPNTEHKIKTTAELVIIEKPLEGHIDPVCVAYVSCPCDSEHRILIA